MEISSEPVSYDEHYRSGLDLGGDHFCHLEYRTPAGHVIGLPASSAPKEGWVLIGLQENHHKPDGTWCGGWVGFTNVDDPGEGWHKEHAKHLLESVSPLTVSPSLLCRTCGNHGYIRESRWVDA